MQVEATTKIRAIIKANIKILKTITTVKEKIMEVITKISTSMDNTRVNTEVASKDTITRTMPKAITFTIQ